MNDEDDQLVHNRLLVLLQQERRYALPVPYHNNSGGIRKSHREKMCVWGFQILDHFGYDRETASVYASNLDRFLSKRFANEHPHQIIIDKREFQLVAMSCLFIAVKVHEPHHMTQHSFCLSAVSDLSNGTFTEKEIYQMECTVLARLNWNVHPPTILSFLRCLVRELEDCSLDSSRSPDDEEIPIEIMEFLIELSCFLSELAVCDADTFCVTLTSRMALACLFTALDWVGLDYVPLGYRKKFLLSVSQMLHLDRNDLAEKGSIFKTQDRLLYLFSNTKSAERYSQYRSDDDLLPMKDISTLLQRQKSDHSKAIRVSFSDETQVHSEGDMQIYMEINNDTMIHSNKASRPRAITEETANTLFSDASMELSHSDEEHVNNASFQHTNNASSPSKIKGINGMRYNKSDGDFYRSAFQCPLENEHRRGDTFNPYNQDQNHPKHSRHLSLNYDTHQ